MIAGGLMLLAAVSGVVHYDCTITDISAAGVGAASGTWKRSQPAFPGIDKGDWRFTVDVNEGDDAKAIVGWDKDYANIAGSAPVLRLADGVFAFVIIKSGGCMFGEQVCMATIQVGDVGKDKAHVAVTPAGIASAGEGKPKDVIQVSLLGNCSRTETLK